MSKILFNNISNSSDYLKNIALLHSDYDMFRKKHFSNQCINLLKKIYTKSEVLLTHSATGALEMVASLIDIKPQDEIIMPSFTFVSTANAFVNKGATPVFVDVKNDTLNVDETIIEQAITQKTKAIIAMHYAGHPCNMEAIKLLCEKYHLYLIEDAAMAYGMFYDSEPLGSIGDFGVVSFDITKHITAIQGGMLLVNNPNFIQRADQIYHIGTNRKQFDLGKVAQYEWVDLGSKYQMNELNAAILQQDLTNSKSIINHRIKLSKLYHDLLNDLEVRENYTMIGKELLDNNIHEFYLIVKNKEVRDKLMQFLSNKRIEAHFRYQPLHLAPMGRKVGRCLGGNNTEEIAQKIIRLPLNNLTTESEVAEVSKQIKAFYEQWQS
jgi:dTDP-4-amino-4,6-dideoxygalactose transaminase